MTSLQSWLCTLDADDLAAVLRHRPDTLRGVEPRGPAELADRLEDAYSVSDALQSAPTPVLELLHALLAVGTAHRKSVSWLLDGGDAENHDEQVGRTLDWLRVRAIVWPGDDDTLTYAAALHQLIPTPLGLGTAARLLLDPINADTLNKSLTQLGLPRQKTKGATVDVLVAALSDGERIRSLVAVAPPDVAAELRRRAWAGLDDDPYDDPYDDVAGGRAALQAAWELRHRTNQWAIERGLVQQSYWGAPAEMAAEVALALRGPDYRAPFHPVPPRPGARRLDPVALDREARVAVASFTDRSASVLDLLARAPVKALKSGGVGARELARLGKQSGCSEPELRLVLELAGETGLLSVGAQVGVSGDFAGWRADEPATRFAHLLWTWWQLPATPTDDRDADGKPTAALRRPGQCPACLGARRGLVAAAAELAPDAAAEPRELVASLLWSRPLVHLVGNHSEPAVWQEAEQLGVLAHGALTDLGRALATDDLDAVRGQAGELLPAATDHATFGSDLTVVVSGQPSARVSGTLDAAADRESRGAATVWRFTAGSVRRALDEGAKPEGLLGDLQAVATGELPQPLRYLVTDVARRHGSLRVRAAVGVVLVDDAALAAQVAADRSLRALHLRLVAPTVLLTDSDTTAALPALRKAGYLPVSEDDAGVRIVEGVPRPAQKPPRDPAVREAPAPAPGPVDFAAAAGRILADGAQGSDALAASPTEALIASHTRRLRGPEVRLLAHAVDIEGAVTIDYRASSGGHTRRTISNIELVGGQLLAWCHLRTDDRHFALDRIRSVSPAPPS